MPWELLSPNLLLNKPVISFKAFTLFALLKMIQNPKGKQSHLKLSLPFKTPNNLYARLHKHIHKDHATNSKKINRDVEFSFAHEKHDDEDDDRRWVSQETKRRKKNCMYNVIDLAVHHLL